MKIQMVPEFSFRNVRSLQKSAQTLAKELAVKDAEQIKTRNPKFFSCHRPELGTEYISCLVNELASQVNN